MASLARDPDCVLCRLLPSGACHWQRSSAGSADPPGRGSEEVERTSAVGAGLDPRTPIHSPRSPSRRWRSRTSESGSFSMRRVPNRTRDIVIARIGQHGAFRIVTPKGVSRRHSVTTRSRGSGERHNPASRDRRAGCAYRLLGCPPHLQRCGRVVSSHIRSHNAPRRLRARGRRRERRCRLVRL